MSPSTEPYNEEKYKALMDGLEIGEIKLSELERTSRIDAEFYRKENVLIAKRLRELTNNPITEYFFVSDGNHMSISSEFTNIGIPYYRGQDIYHVFIEGASPICIDEKTYSHPHMERSHLRAGDILMSIVGAIIGNSAIVSSDKKATCSCKLAILRSKNNGILPETLLSYIKTKYGQNQIQKFKRGAAQTGFLLEDFEQVFIPEMGIVFQNRIKEIVMVAQHTYFMAESVYSDTEQMFLENIGFSLEEPQISFAEKSYRISFGVTGRLDAEFYQPKYDILFSLLKKQSYKTLSGDDGLVDMTKSIEPGSDAYRESGIPFVRVSDIDRFGISQPEIYLSSDIVEDIQALYPRKNTILFSKDGSVGIAYKMEKDAQLITSGALLHLTIRDTNTVLPDYLTLVLNSPVVQMQAERDSNGAIIQHWKPSEIANVIIPILDMSIQQEIASKVQESFALRKQSKELLEYAKGAVEMSIEQGEDVALAWLKEKVNV